MAFPVSPTNGQIYNNKIFDVDRWRNLKSIKVPNDTLINSNYGNIPAFPTGAAGAIYNSNFTSGADGWSSIHTSTVVQSGGKIVYTATGADPHFGRGMGSNIAGKYLYIHARLVSGQPIGEAYTFDGGGNRIAFDTGFGSAKQGEWKTYKCQLPSVTNTHIRLDMLGDAGQVEIYRIYVGDDTYDSLALNDESGNNYDQQTAAGCRTVPGILGTALYADTGNGAISSSGVISRSGEVTLSVWRKWDGRNGAYDRPIISMCENSEGYDYGVGIFYGYGYDFLCFANSTLYSLGQLTDDTNWNHFAVTYTTSYVKVYKNGSHIFTLNGPIDLRQVSSYLRVGYAVRPGISRAAFDNPRVYSRALSDSEIKALASFRKDNTYTMY